MPDKHPIRSYLRRFFTSWAVTDPAPAYSALDKADGRTAAISIRAPRMGDIGEDQREYEMEPISTPVTVPVETPSTPAPEKEPVPA